MSMSQAGPRQNPGKWGGGVVALASAGLGVLTTFGVGITPEQNEAILMFTTVAGPLVAGWWGDSKTTPLAEPRTPDGVPLYPAPPNARFQGRGPQS